MMLQERDLAERLRLAGLRPTRQRVSLATILFGAGDRHVSAESLHQEAVAARMNVSLATVYNTLNQFKAAGFSARSPSKATVPSSTPIPRTTSTTSSRTLAVSSTSARMTWK
jgi:hypothetical protein